jgi:hypothetical protein
MLGAIELDYNSDNFSFKKLSPSTRKGERILSTKNVTKIAKKKKYLSYLRIDIRNLRTDDSSSLMITDEFKKDINDKAR